MKYEWILRDIQERMDKDELIDYNGRQYEISWNIFVHYECGDDIIDWDPLNNYVLGALYLATNDLMKEEQYALWQLAVDDMYGIKQEQYLKEFGVDYESDQYYCTYGESVVIDFLFKVLRKMASVDSTSVLEKEQAEIYRHSKINSVFENCFELIDTFREASVDRLPGIIDNIENEISTLYKYVIEEEFE